MKPKLNLSGDGIKSFFFNNGEKLVLGVTVVVLLLFLYGAITAKPLDDKMSPRTISTKAAEKQRIIQEPSPPPSVPPIQVSVKQDPINYEDVRWPQEWKRPLFPELRLR